MKGSEKFFRVYKTRGFILLDNFLGGIAWGVGSIIGATVIIGLLGWTIVLTKNVPIWGELVKTVIEKIDEGKEKVTNHSN